MAIGGLQLHLNISLKLKFFKIDFHRQLKKAGDFLWAFNLLTASNRTQDNIF